MRSFCFATVLLLTFGSHAAAQKARVSSEKALSWFGTCRSREFMGLEVVMQGQVIHRSSFPICPIKYRSRETEKTIAFSLKGGYVFQGEYHTARTEMITGNIWQAGIDPGVILLGVSFVSKKQVLLNTIHFAKVGSASATEIDRGLVVRTFPILKK